MKKFGAGALERSFEVVGDIEDTPALQPYAKSSSPPPTQGKSGIFLAIGEKGF